jgi:plastocyanin
VSVRTRILALVGLLVVVPFVVVALVRPTRVAGQTGAPHAHAHANMTEAAMKRWAETFWATHRPVGENAAHQVATATFTVQNFRFDLDNNATTAIDTAKIFVGETVMWQWIEGSHTITNGNDSGDPNVGTLFDQPSDQAHPTFSHTFNTVGTVPFFCRPHEGSMAGVVVVRSQVGVEPTSPVSIGFTADPSPNPSHRGVRFTFALREGGHVRAEVFDAGGRRIARVLDQDFPAGPHDGSWNGLRSDGAAAGAGIYYLRLRLPGYSGSRAIAITR